MTLPLDTTPLRDAVVRALTQPTGYPDSLGLTAPAAGAKHAFFIEVFEDPSAGEALRPCARIDLHGHAPTDHPMLGGDRRREQVTIEVTTWHSAGVTSAEAKRARAIVERDKQRVIAALSSEGAFAYDPDGNETGADSGILRIDRYSSTGPEFPKRKNDPRIAKTVHVFRTAVELRRTP